MRCSSRGEIALHDSDQWMFRRIGCQAVAVLLLLLLSSAAMA